MVTIVVEMIFLKTAGNGERIEFVGVHFINNEVYNHRLIKGTSYSFF